ncbi:MAG: c-type cytochrome [Pseudomonadota bacterium]
MFDTMTLTKLTGGFCGAFLIFLLGGFGAEFIYHANDHHGDDHHQAYTIDTGGDDEAEEETIEVAFADVYAAADVSEGPTLFRKCSACHKVEAGANGAGPYLHNVVGRDVGGASGFSAYSGALSEVADVWTPENLNAFLENPKGFASGTTMNFAGFDDVEDRANLIAWLATQTE